MSDYLDLSNKEIFDKFGQIVIENIQYKTCKNVQSILSGYSAAPFDAELFLEYTKLDDRAKRSVNKLLLCTVNSAIANFLFFLSDFDQLNVFDSIVINTYYIDNEGNKKRIVDIYDNWSGLFSCDWLEHFSTFKEEISPENPRRTEFIKVFPIQEKNSNTKIQDNTVESQADIENMIAKVKIEVQKEQSYNSGSLYLLQYLSHRFPNMKPDQWDEIEKMGNHDGDMFSDMFDIALESQSLEGYLEEIRQR